MRKISASIMLLLTSVFFLPSCERATTIRGTVSDSAAGVVKFSRVGWKQGLLTGGRFLGKVYDKWETGYVIGNGSKVLGGPPDAVVATDQDGAFVLTGLPAGDVTLFLSTDNVKWGAYEVRRLARGETRVVVIDVDALTDIEEARQEELVLECREEGNRLNCVLKSLSPIEEAQIIMFRGSESNYMERPAPVRQVTVTPDGCASISLDGLDAGEYTLLGLARRKDRIVQDGRQITCPFVYRPAKG
jgi:hypothetical protein